MVEPGDHVELDALGAYRSALPDLGAGPEAFVVVLGDHGKRAGVPLRLTLRQHPEVGDLGAREQFGDKAYSSRGNRAAPQNRGIKAVIPQPSTQIGNRQRRGSAGGRPPAFDAATYEERNVVERSFNGYKQWRGIATRYDKLATTYRGAVVLRAITIWLTT